MPISKKQLNRLVRLVGQLKENRYPNCVSFAADLRKLDLTENINLACTEKTIYRDIQLLKSDFEAPIKFSKERNGYYLAHHGWTFSCPQLFDDSEMLAAVLGARISEHIFPTAMKKQIRDAVDYLLTYNNPEFLDQMQVDSLVVIPSNRTQINADIFMPLFHAWQNHEVCHIEYQDSQGKTSKRNFEPHTLIFFDGVWYSKGFCHERKQIRTLVLPRMRSVIPTGKYFESDPKIIKTVNEESIFDPELVSDVKIVCDEYLANIIQTRPLHPEQKVIELSNGGCEVYVESMSKYRLVTWIMHQCGRATIQQPIIATKEIIDFARQIEQNHQCVFTMTQNIHE